MIYASAKHAEDARQVIRVRRILPFLIMLNLEDRTPIRLTVKLNCFPDGRERMAKLEEIITEHSLPINWRTSEDYVSFYLNSTMDSR